MRKISVDVDVYSHCGTRREESCGSTLPSVFICGITRFYFFRLSLPTVISTALLNFRIIKY